VSIELEVMATWSKEVKEALKIRVMQELKLA
jgi:hypothetical protein